MALSGSATTRVGSYWYLDLEWSATQNHDDNTSTVTAKLYWRSESSYSVSSSATKDGSITLGGLTSGFSGAGLAGLSAGQKKLIHTYKRTIEHSPTGTLAIAINAVFNPEVTLSGTYYGSVSVSDGTQTINTIPRESKLNDTTPNWTAGSDITLSFTRYSSSFNHRIDIYLQNADGTATMPSGATGWTGLKATHLKALTYSTSQTSLSSSFSTDEKYEIFERLAGGSSIKAWVRLTTYSGTTQIGDPMNYFSTVTAPSASTTAVGNFTLGNTVSIPITRSDSEFKHEVKVTVGSWSKVLDADTTTSYSWTSSTDKASILPQISSTSTTGTATFTITTYFYHSNGTWKQKVRSATTDTATVTIPSTESPTFTGAVTWADTASITLNGTTTTMNTLKGTGNELVMVQSKSKLVVTLPSTALGTAKAGTTMKQYTVTINGVTRTVAHPATATTLTFTFVESELNVATNQTMIVKAYDNRNLSTSVNKTVTFVPYSVPVVTGKAIRNNGFDNPSTVGASGTISTVSINSSNKNSISKIQYQYKVKGASDSTYSALADLTIGTATFPAYKANDKTDLDLDNTKSYTVKLVVTDKFGQNSITKDIATGVPIMFMDSVKKSIGVGMLPQYNGTFETGGQVRAKHFNFTDSLRQTAIIERTGGDINGDHIRLGGGGAMVMGAGESTFTFTDQFPTLATESFFLTADGYGKLITNMNLGYADRYEWMYGTDGILYNPRNKEANGYNMVTTRSNTAHDDLMLIQDFKGSISVAGMSYVDIVFPTAFNATPDWVLVCGRESSSSSFLFAVYNATATGCRIYGNHIHNVQTAYTTYFQVVACGRKA